MSVIYYGTVLILATAVRVTSETTGPLGIDLSELVTELDRIAAEEKR